MEERNREAASGMVVRAALVWGVLCAAGTWSAGAATNGPLRVSEQNPRYFADSKGNAILLTGSHTWENLQDSGYQGNVNPFDYEGYLDFLEQRHHNYIRLWRWEMPKYRYHDNQEFRVTTPHPFARTGPGTAGDGGLKYNLNVYEQSHLDRLRQRVMAARDRGIYVSVMLFEGHALQFTDDGWFAHPFNAANNVNGVNGDANGDGRGTESHTLANPAVQAVQAAYIRKVVDTVNDLDNVMYEVANESIGASMDWQRWVIDTVKAYEATKPYQHPVIFSTPLADVGTDIWNSNADAVVPGTSVEVNGSPAYKNDPPANDGAKVVFNDTDHLWGCGGTATWVWQSFTRGLNPIYMDPYDDDSGCGTPSERLRLNLGYALDVSRRVDMNRMVPHNELSSTQYCLADPGVSYVVLLPVGGGVNVNLGAVTGGINAEWLNVSTGQTTAEPNATGGGLVQFTAPFEGTAVLILGAGMSACAGDLNSDGLINIDDLTMVIQGWGPCGGNCPADWTGDGVVSIDDLTVVILNWNVAGDGPCAPVGDGGPEPPDDPDPPGDTPPGGGGGVGVGGDPLNPHH